MLTVPTEPSVSACIPYASSGLSSAPYTEFATSVGRADGYSARAEVVVVPTTPHAGCVYAYSSDGRNVLGDLQAIGAAPPTLTVRIDSLSDSPRGIPRVSLGGSPRGSQRANRWMTGRVTVRVTAWVTA